MRNALMTVYNVMKIIAFCFFLVVTAHLFYTANKINNIETVCLYSIGKNTEYSGSFILGCADVKNTSKYIAYKIDGDGGKMYYELDRSKTIIYDTLEVDKNF